MNESTFFKYIQSFFVLTLISPIIKRGWDVSFWQGWRRRWRRAGGKGCWAKLYVFHRSSGSLFFVGSRLKGRCKSCLKFGLSCCCRCCCWHNKLSGEWGETVGRGGCRTSFPERTRVVKVSKALNGAPHFGNCGQGAGGRGQAFWGGTWGGSYLGWQFLEGRKDGIILFSEKKLIYI